MNLLNEMDMNFKAISINEGFARTAVASFCVQMSPTIDELTEIKTAVSEAVTNAVVHAYPNKEGWIYLNAKLYDTKVVISIADKGVGIEDFEKAREPFFTSKPEEERSGMGFTVMESFMDKVTLEHNEGGGVVVVMEKNFNKSQKNIVG
ncbi:MAG: anti-sigma F factor [Clostridia bacterium]